MKCSICPECGRENPSGSNFCNQCGWEFGKARYTRSIDYSQPHSYTPKFLAEKILRNRSWLEGERKLVTVLFADVAGYTAMSERLDPEKVHQVMNGCFIVLMDVIHRFEGTVNQFTGDGVMALFGAPVSHEDHAQRACYAALSIQEAIRKYGGRIEESFGIEFKMRVGLNSGQVIVGSIGDDLRMDYTAIGDTTNLASRIENISRPGSVWVSESTYKLARDFFEFRSQGKVRVKGRKYPQELYELVRAGAVETRIQAEVVRGPTRFVGRAKEMEALKEVFDQARSGSGQVIGITGDAGVGKSRLFLEFRNILTQGESTCLEGRCLHYGESMAYLPILDMLSSYFDIQEGDSEEEIQGKVRDRVGRLDGKLASAMPPLQELLSVKVEDEAYLQIDPQQRKQRTFVALRNLLTTVSKEKPLLLVMEDVHWIDKNSQEFLDFLAGGLEEASVLLILLYRPEYRETLAGRVYCREIPLDQLSERSSAELVQALLNGGEVAPEVTDLVLTRAGGNPLFVEELIRSLLDSGAIRRTDHRYELAPDVSALEVPDTIQGIIAARMDRVGEGLKRMMQVASVIGIEFGFRILENVTGMKEELTSCLAHLQGLEFIYERQASPEPEYAFRHALTQEVAYNGLLSHIRRETHEKAGKAIEDLYPERLEEYYELLAHHYVRSDNTEKAVEYLSLASQKAGKAHALKEAVAHFEKAMELLDALPDTQENRQRRISLLLSQSNVFFMLMKSTEYHDLLVRFRSVAAELDNPGLLGALYSRLGWYEFSFGYLDQAIETLTKAAELCNAAGNVEEAGFVFNFLVACHLFRSDYDRVFELKDDLLRAMEQKFTLRCYVRGLVFASQAYAHQGRWDEAVGLGNKALSAAEDFSDDSLFATAAIMLSAVYTFKRDLDQAIKYAQWALARAPTLSDKAWAQTFLAWALCNSGETRKGIELLAGLVPIFRSVRNVMVELWSTLFLAEGYWLAGEYDKGRQTAEELLEIADRCGVRFCIGYAHFLLGGVSLETRPAEAASHFDKSIAIFREIKAENVLAMAYAGYGRLHKEQGRIAEAREYLAGALAIFERLGTLIEPEKLRKELAELPGRTDSTRPMV